MFPSWLSSLSASFLDEKDNSKKSGLTGLVTKTKTCIDFFTLNMKDDYFFAIRDVCLLCLLEWVIQYLPCRKLGLDAGASPMVKDL